MVATKQLAKSAANSIGGARVDSESQNRMAFVVILLLSMLVFLLAETLSTNPLARQADVTADLRP